MGVSFLYASSRFPCFVWIDFYCIEICSLLFHDDVEILHSCNSQFSSCSLDSEKILSACASVDSVILWPGKIYRKNKSIRIETKEQKDISSWRKMYGVDYRFWTICCHQFCLPYFPPSPLYQCARANSPKILAKKRMGMKTT